MNSSPRVDIVGLARSSSHSNIGTRTNDDIDIGGATQLPDLSHARPQFAQENKKSPCNNSRYQKTGNSKEKIKFNHKTSTNIGNNDRSFLNTNDDDNNDNESERYSRFGFDNSKGDVGSKDNDSKKHYSFLTPSRACGPEQSDKERGSLVVEQHSASSRDSGPAVVRTPGSKDFSVHNLTDNTHNQHNRQDCAFVAPTTTTTSHGESELQQHKPRMEATVNARPVADGGMGDDRTNGYHENQQQTQHTCSLGSTNALKPDDLEAGRNIRRSASRASMPLSHHHSTNNAADNPSNDVNNNNNDASSTVEDFSWGPNHPCFPHLNPHVPLSSPLHASTRIIRIRRDWMPNGDLAPQFANLYPEILDPLMPEEQFRGVVEHVNRELAEAFSPWTARSWVDAAMGVLTGWMWDDLGMTGVKKRLEELEAWIERWNSEWGRRGEGGVETEEYAWIVPLRRTGYLTVSDFTLNPISFFFWVLLSFLLA